MAQGTKTENTAVNRLIEMAHERPLETDDALFSSPPPGPRKSLPRPFPGRIATAAPVDPPDPMPRTRAPQSTQTQLAAAPPAPRPVASALAEAEAEEDDLDVDVDVDDDAPVTFAGVAPQGEEVNWYEDSVDVDRVDEAVLGTHGVSRGGRAKTMLWLSAAFAAGLVATAIVAWPGKSVVNPPAPAPAPAAVQPAKPAQPAVVAAAAAEPTAVAAVEPAVVAPAAAVEPAAGAAGAEAAVIAPAPAAEPAVAIVKVALESEPAGATVMLVEASGARAIGTTPMAYAVDPSQPVEIMFKLEGHRSSLVTVDPAASKRVTVDLASSKVTQEATAEPVAEVAAVEPARPAKTAKTEPARARKPEPKAAARVARAEPVRAAASKPTGGGVLMLGAKPPCDIFIDGKSTGLKTPQRALKVSPGSHKITLVNREHKITETFSIDVKAGSPTKVVKDLTKRMK